MEEEFIVRQKLGETIVVFFAFLSMIVIGCDEDTKDNKDNGESSFPRSHASSASIAAYAFS